MSVAYNSPYYDPYFSYFSKIRYLDFRLRPRCFFGLVYALILTGLLFLHLITARENLILHKQIESRDSERILNSMFNHTKHFDSESDNSTQQTDKVHVHHHHIHHHHIIHTSNSSNSSSPEFDISTTVASKSIRPSKLKSSSKVTQQTDSKPVLTPKTYSFLQKFSKIKTCPSTESIYNFTTTKCNPKYKSTSKGSLLPIYQPFHPGPSEQTYGLKEVIISAKFLGRPLAISPFTIHRSDKLSKESMVPMGIRVDMNKLCNYRVVLQICHENVRKWLKKAENGQNLPG